MGNTSDEMKGRAKEAVGDLTDDDELRHDGQADRTSAKVKGVVEKGKDKVEDLVDDAKDAIRRH